MIRRLFLRGRSAPPPPPFPQVALFHWRPGDGGRNFGDELSPIVVDAVARSRGRTLTDAVATPRRLLAVGSILHYARDGDVVWGTGVRERDWLPPPGIRLDIRAVRGPLSAAALRAAGHAVPEIYGDSALLLPRLFPGWFDTGPRSAAVLVVPHFGDLSPLGGPVDAISPFEGWNRCAARIARAGFVVSASLHGIVLADAFGVPVRRLRLAEGEPDFKFDDYALATGRARLVPAKSVEEAMAMGPERPPQIDLDALLAAFPHDLWD